MKGFSRRSLLKSIGTTLPAIWALGYAKISNAAEWSKEFSAATQPNDVTVRRKALEISNSKEFAPGYLSILQGPTSDDTALFNILAPRLKKYTYEIYDSAGTKLTPEKYDSVKGPGFYNVDKIKITGLRLQEQYRLRVMDNKTQVDERLFRTLDIHKAVPNFALISCMADDYRFNEVIEPMWDRLKNEKPDFLILNGDTVYVDSFEFVERLKATEADLWQRYVDTLKRLPLYHWRELVPVFSTWDDHDFGTNDSDREFVSKEAALKLFHAVFGGTDIPGVWEQGPGGVSSALHAFGQSFYFMDDRTFRQPNKNQTTQEEYGHWGQGQHTWLLNSLTSKARPAWVVNGNQCFNGKDLSYKETFEGNHPKEFVNFINQLKNIPSPVVFASGDVHLSEIMRIPRERIGYETYEVTSSSMHSYTGEGWENPMRLDGTLSIEFNFLMIRSQASTMTPQKAIQLQVKCVGVEDAPYFEKTLQVRSM